MIHFIFFCLTFPKKKVCYALIISGMPTWRNGRRAAFRSQSAYAGEGSSPFVGTNFTLKNPINSPKVPHFYCGVVF